MISFLCLEMATTYGISRRQCYDWNKAVLYNWSLRFSTVQSLHVNSKQSFFYHCACSSFSFLLFNFVQPRCLSFLRSVCWFPCFVLTLGCYPCASVRLSAIRFLRFFFHFFYFHADILFSDFAAVSNSSPVRFHVYSWAMADGHFFLSGVVAWIFAIWVFTRMHVKLCLKFFFFLIVVHSRGVMPVKSDWG